MRQFALFAISATLLAAQTGVFESHGDVGVNPKPGSVEFANGVYRITGGGANVWANADAFRYVYRQITGDASLSADMHFEGKGVRTHRKMMLMFRKNLSAGSPYIDIAVHGDGLTSMQFRKEQDGTTGEVQTTVKAPESVRIVRRGSTFAAYQGSTEIASQNIDFGSGPLYIGLGVCSHDADVLETGVFSNVRLDVNAAFRSKVAIFDLSSRQSKVIYEQDGIVEAPNWSRDGKFLLVNTAGDLYRLMLDSAKLEKIQLRGGSTEYRCNNDHDLSPDGKLIAFSASTPQVRQSQVFVANADGSNVRLLTPASPSYFHGWSRDGRWLAFVARREAAKQFEVYRVSVDGGAEERLTFEGGYDDGPEYFRKWIYFNSNRAGKGWNIWRIPVNGGAGKAEQVTDDALEDWFPHWSPNGKHMVFLSFPAGTEGHNGRMPGMKFRMMEGKKIVELATFSGGQGTINVNSWAPDSKRFAYVIYESK